MSLSTTLQQSLERESPEAVAERVLRNVLAARKAREEREAEEARRKAASEAPAPVPQPKPAPAGMRLHYKFPLLLAAVKAGVDGIALVGPAGTGKTTAARQAAKLTERHFEAVSFGPTTSGVRMEIIADWTSSWGDMLFTYRIPVKHAEEPMDRDRVAFALCHPSMLRRLLFRLNERRGEYGRRGRDTYGTPCNPPYEQDAFIMPCMHLSNVHWQHPPSATLEARRMINEVLKLTGR